MVEQTDKRKIYIVGGGLAGMLAAYHLQDADVPVTLFEAEDRLGGRARSIDADPIHLQGRGSGTPQTIDKGYHLFPGWYRNTWRLIAELGIEANFTAPHALQSDHYAYVSAADAGVAPDTVPDWDVVNPSDFRQIFRRGRVQLLLTMLGLAGANRATLEGSTLNGFIFSRWYVSKDKARYLQRLAIKALANESRLASALTMQSVVRNWILARDEAPWRACKGSLQESFIEPLETALDSVAVKRRAKLSGISTSNSGDIITELQFGNRTIDVMESDVVIFALPHDVFFRLVMNDPGLRRDEALANLGRIPTGPFGVVELQFSGQLQYFTPRHFTLAGSKYAITGIDISQLWDSYSCQAGGSGTRLQLVAGEVASIADLPKDEFVHAIVTEMQRYIRFDTDWIDVAYAVTGRESPVTLNEVGTDRFRPETGSGCKNMLVAGDAVRTDVGVSSMEGAIISGMRAADLARKRLGIASDVEDAIVIQKWPSRIQLVLTLFAAVSWLGSVVFGVLAAPYRSVRRLVRDEEDSDRLKLRRATRRWAAGGLIFAMAALVGLLWVVPSWLERYDWLGMLIGDLGREGVGHYVLFVLLVAIYWIALQALAVPLHRTLPGGQVVVGLVASLSAAVLVLGLAQCSVPCLHLGASDASWMDWVHAIAAVVSFGILVAIPTAVASATRRLRSRRWTYVVAVVFSVVTPVLLVGFLVAFASGQSAGLWERLFWISGHVPVLAVALAGLVENDLYVTPLVGGPGDTATRSDADVADRGDQSGFKVPRRRLVSSDEKKRLKRWERDHSSPPS